MTDTGYVPTVVKLAPDVGVLVDARRVHDGGSPFPATASWMHASGLSSAINWGDVPTWLATVGAFLAARIAWHTFRDERRRDEAANRDHEELRSGRATPPRSRSAHA